MRPHRRADEPCGRRGPDVPAQEVAVRVHAGERPDPTTHAHRTPIYATATFTFDSAAEKEEAVDRALAWEPDAFFYSRTGNPTNRALEEKIASLEGAEDAVVSSSGMAAVAHPMRAPEAPSHSASAAPSERVPDRGP